MYSSFSYICLITLSKVDGIALRRRCDQRDSVIRLRKINEGNMQSRTVPGLQLFCSMPNKMPQNKQRVQSASARKEAKLRVWNLILFHTPISHQIFQHVGENTIHYPTNSNHPIWGDLSSTLNGVLHTTAYHGWKTLSFKTESEERRQEESAKFKTPIKLNITFCEQTSSRTS